MPNFFYKSAIITTFFVLWAIGIITFVTVVTFLFTPDIPMGTATALGAVYGLPAIAVGLYKWRVEKSAKSKISLSGD